MSASEYPINGGGINVFASCMIGLSAALCLAIPTGYSYGSALLCLAALPVLALKRPKRILTRDDIWFLSAYVLYFAVSSAINLIHQLPGRSFEEPSRFVLAAAIVPMLLAYPPRAVFWWAGIALGSFAAGIIALWEAAVLAQPRADGFINPIQFGNLALLTGMLCLAGMSWANGRRYRHLWQAALGVGSLCGLLASLLSGSRGGWLALPVILGLLYLGCRSTLNRRLLAGGVASIVVLMALLYAIPQTGVQSRLDRAAAEWDAYSEEGDVASSVGLRLEMWRIGFSMAAERPWIGWGDEAYTQPMASRVEDPIASRKIGGFNHLHSDVLDTLIKRGLPGLLALLTVYTVPFVLFWRLWRSADPRRGASARAFSVAGMIVVVSVALFGLTQAFLRHNSGVTIYAFYVAVLWCYARSALRDGERS